VIDRLAGIVAKMALDPSIQKRMHGFGSIPASSSPEAFAGMLRKETTQWASLVKEIGLK
jgi:tripartite-type tricarboxylate transporter receptor subunit TctC